MLSWAHGTVGSADKCAPSMDSDSLGPPEDTGIGQLRKINKAPHKLLNAFLRAGWIVAMTDYEGLGTRGIHPFLLGDSEGRGVVDIVPTAHQLVDQVMRAHAMEGVRLVSDKYAIVGHSQGGQAALFAASLADTYASDGTLIGVAALAPASNLKGDGPLVPNGENGLLKAYQSPTSDPDVIGDVGAFYPLFTNGVLGGDPGIDLDEIFQTHALVRFQADRDSKARAELSEPQSFWMTTPPLKAMPDRAGGIFRDQALALGTPGYAARKEAWRRYWEQVDKFTPEVRITAPIRISQASKDPRVAAEKTGKLIGQLGRIEGQGPITTVFYYPPGTAPGEDFGPDVDHTEIEKDLQVPDPPSLKEHFGLLVDDTEIALVLSWTTNLL